MLLQIMFQSLSNASHDSKPKYIMAVGRRSNHCASALISQVARRLMAGAYKEMNSIKRCNWLSQCSSPDAADMLLKLERAGMQVNATIHRTDPRW